MGVGWNASVVKMGSLFSVNSTERVLNIKYHEEILELEWPVFIYIIYTEIADALSELQHLIINKRTSLKWRSLINRHEKGSSNFIGTNHKI